METLKNISFTLTLLSGVLIFVNKYVFLPLYNIVKNYKLLIDTIEAHDKEITELKASNRTLLNIFENPILICDNQGNCIFVNKRFTEVTGLSVEAAKGDGWLLMVTEIAKRDQLRKEWSEAQKDNSEFLFDATIYNRISQSEFTVIIRGYFYRKNELLILYTGTLDSTYLK